MVRSAREVALTIWQTGVNAVRAEQLIDDRTTVDESQLVVDGARYDLEGVQRICLVGAGKAAGYLAKSLEDKLSASSALLNGWVNVPANCVIPTRHVHLHAARPAEVNEPRVEGVEGSAEILRQVAALDAEDLCICVLTGGGSALLPSPAPGVTLEDKVLVTRLLSSRGASIQDLNRLRTALSSIKGGGLARACGASRLITLIISDVIGDPLEVIASGPTVVSRSDTAQELLALLEQFVDRDEVPASIWECLASYQPQVWETRCHCTHHVLANNDRAVQAAAAKARDLGLQVRVLPPELADTEVPSVAATLAKEIRELSPGSCMVWGGEPVIRLTTVNRGMGGRNQHLALSVLHELMPTLEPDLASSCCWLSGGTDGEDGPTDAAGACVDRDVIARIRSSPVRVDDVLARNDSYTLFSQTGGLIHTGPTHTNVCDLRVAVRLP